MTKKPTYGELELKDKELEKEAIKHKQIEQDLRKARNDLEMQVEKRTSELFKANQKLELEIKERKRIEKELRHKTENLEEMNAALKVLLKKREDDKVELEEKMLSNVKQLIEPYIAKLKQSSLNERQKTCLKIIRTHVDDIISPFARELSSVYYKLTPKEIQIASLIKEGKTNKEIAEILSSALKTIEFHRANIRKKIGLGSKANLRTHLLSLL